MSKNIVLIGFMGVGKSTISRALAKEMGAFCLDTDLLIEERENRKIKSIFEEDGEEHFRKLEKKCAKWLEKSVKNSIIATGGGFFKVKNLHKIGTIVYLRSSFESILERLKKEELATRPLLSNLDKAKALYLERCKEYEDRANIIIDVEKRKPKEVVRDLIKLLD